MSYSGEFPWGRPVTSQTIELRPVGVHAGRSEERKELGDSKQPRRVGQVRNKELFYFLMQLARQFDKPVSASELMALAGSRDESLNFDEFTTAAHRLGLTLIAQRLTAKTLRSNSLPMIVLHSGTSDAVLILSRQENGLRILDPSSKSTRVLSIAEVKAIGDQILSVKATEPFNWANLVRGATRHALWQLVSASLFLNLFALTPPLFMMTVYNKVIAHNALDTLDILVLGMVLVYSLEALLRGLRSYVASHAGTKLDALLSKEVAHRILNTSFNELRTTSTGLIREKFGQLDVIQQFFTSQMPLVLVDAAFIFVFVTALFFISTTLATVTILAMPVPVIFSIFFYRAQKRLNEQKFGVSAARSTLLSEAVARATTIKGLALEPEIERRLANKLAAGAVTSLKAARSANAINVASVAIQQVAHLAIIFLGARLVMSGELSFGALIAASLLAARALAPLRQCVSAIQQFHDVRTAFSQLDGIVSTGDRAVAGRLQMPPVLESVKFEAATFGYGDGVAKALDEVSLEIAAGQIVGVTGRPGCGKSTLVKLVCGLLRPNAGRVLVNGTDLSHFSGSAWRGGIGFVPQEIELFAGTIRENIGLAVPDAPFEHIVAAARFALAHEFIQDLPLGYETLLTENGLELSAGQRQQICIARAVLRDPRVLILDEATSALDRDTEMRLMSNIRQRAAGRVIVVVSHRPIPLMCADLIVYMADGRIANVERVGRQTALVRANG
ncbi:MAG TPA: peptidase domain-containing ABC transporter [Alphaproteobacteria bacterium]|nr:peptidase domain-containing ABC transporter [Alphaproteobacteria bacterium]